MIIDKDSSGRVSYFYLAKVEIIRLGKIKSPTLLRK